jgi:O-acetylserine/cysteine efflux transporter
MLVPVVGLSASAVLLGEDIEVATAVGAALVIGGVLWGSLRKANPPVPSGVEEEAPPHLSTRETVGS